MDTKTFKKVFSNKTYVRSLFQLETPEQMQSSLKEQSIELTDRELHAICSIYQSKLDGDKELSPEVLEMVAGGGWFSDAFHFICEIFETLFPSSNSQSSNRFS